MYLDNLTYLNYFEYFQKPYLVSQQFFLVLEEMGLG